MCVKGQRLDFTPVQVRSRAVIAQEPENIAQCPDQEWQSRPCTSETCSSSLIGLKTLLYFDFIPHRINTFPVTWFNMHLKIVHEIQFDVYGLIRYNSDLNGELRPNITNRLTIKSRDSVNAMGIGL